MFFVVSLSGDKEMRRLAQKLILTKRQEMLYLGAVAVSQADGTFFPQDLRNKVGDFSIVEIRKLYPIIYTFTQEGIDEPDFRVTKDVEYVVLDELGTNPEPLAQLCSH